MALIAPKILSLSNISISCTHEKVSKNVLFIKQVDKIIPTVDDDPQRKDAILKTSHHENDMNKVREDEDRNRYLFINTLNI